MNYLNNSWFSVVCQLNAQIRTIDLWSFERWFVNFSEIAIHSRKHTLNDTIKFLSCTIALSATRVESYVSNAKFYHSSVKEKQEDAFSVLEKKYPTEFQWTRARATKLWRLLSTIVPAKETRCHRRNKRVLQYTDHRFQERWKVN